MEACLQWDLPKREDFLCGSWTRTAVLENGFSNTFPFGTLKVLLRASDQLWSVIAWLSWEAAGSMCTHVYMRVCMYVCVYVCVSRVRGPAVEGKETLLA